MNFRMLVGSSAVIMLLAVCGCGQGNPGWTVHPQPNRGFTVEFPDSWQLATEKMSRITEPRELFSLGTAVLKWRPTNCEAFAGAAGASMGAADVVVTVWERGSAPHSTWSDFPERPEAFGPVGKGEPGTSGCDEPPGTVTHWRNFRDAGRHFHTLVRIGPDASPGSVVDAWRVLDRLRLDPGYQPAWRASR